MSFVSSKQDKLSAGTEFSVGCRPSCLSRHEVLDASLVLGRDFALEPLGPVSVRFAIEFDLVESGLVEQLADGAVVAAHVLGEFLDECLLLGGSSMHVVQMPLAPQVVDFAEEFGVFPVLEEAGDRIEALTTDIAIRLPRIPDERASRELISIVADIDGDGAVPTTRTVIVDLAEVDGVRSHDGSFLSHDSCQHAARANYKFQCEGGGFAR